MKTLERFVVGPGLTLHEYFERINASSQGILLLVDSNGVLIRTITDGDLRRLLLQGTPLDSRDFKFPDKPPVTAMDDASDDQLFDLMKKNGVNQIPIVDQSGVPTDIVHMRDIEGPILLSTPHMGDQEIDFVNQAFDTNWIAPLGPNVDSFEAELASHVGVRSAAAVSSGTAAIHLALVLLDIGPSDFVFCSSLTFVASANPILYQRAKPVFIDSDPETWNMSPDALESALKAHASNGRLPKAVIVVNLYGQSADIDRIRTICDQYAVPIVEDAAESLGATYKGKASGTFGKFGVYSFNGNKIITTSGGGMLVSHDSELIDKARYLATQARDPAPWYQHSSVGFNYRMSNVLAGIGRGQLRVLDDRVSRRRAIFDRYRDNLSGIEGLAWMPEASYGQSTRWLSVCTLDPRSHGEVVPSRLIGILAEHRIEARHVWKPLHQQPLFDGCDYYPYAEGYSFSDEAFAQGICLPSGSNMTDDDVDRVCNCILEAMS